MVSCDSKYVSVPDSEIESASSWSINDQPPSFPDCENLKNNQHLDCFRNIIEIEINNNNVTTIKYIIAKEILIPELFSSTV